MFLAALHGCVCDQQTKLCATSGECTSIDKDSRCFAMCLELVFGLDSAIQVIGVWRWHPVNSI
jgi:hypothetical protein